MVVRGGFVVVRGGFVVVRGGFVIILVVVHDDSRDDFSSSREHRRKIKRTVCSWCRTGFCVVVSDESPRYGDRQNSRVTMIGRMIALRCLTKRRRDANDTTNLRQPCTRVKISMRCKNANESVDERHTFRRTRRVISIDSPKGFARQPTHRPRRNRTPPTTTRERITPFFPSHTKRQTLTEKNRSGPCSPPRSASTIHDRLSRFAQKKHPDDKNPSSKTAYTHTHTTHKTHVL